jgi:hypothetical protein
VIFAAVIDGMFANPSGPLGNALEEQGRRVVTQAKIHVGRGVNPLFRSTWRNPPPGPPMRRSGILQNSLTSLPAQTGPQGLEVFCIAPAVNPRDSHHYGETLIARDYDFVDLSRLD